jgi:hypothetical protein
MELDKIKYDSIINFTKFFLEKLKEKELKDLDMVIRNVKNNCPYILEMSYVFDETIWHPSNPDLYKNLIEFKVSLVGKASYLPFRLMIKEDLECQEPIFLNAHYMWFKNY